MNGIHDMGGMHGFGPIELEAKEPVFHEPCEARMFGLRRAMTSPPGSTIDRFRFLRESMPPAAYLSWSYYEHWYYSTVRSLLEAGYLTMAELRSGHAAADRVRAVVLRCRGPGVWVRHHLRNREARGERRHIQRRCGGHQ